MSDTILTLAAAWIIASGILMQNGNIKIDAWDGKEHL